MRMQQTSNSVVKITLELQNGHKAE